MQTFRKRSYRLSEFARDLAGLVPHAGALVRGAAGSGRLNFLLREEVLTAVAAQNQCRYCTYIHEGFAQFAGASDEEIALIEGRAGEPLDRRRWVAVCYARAGVTGDVPLELEAQARSLYSSVELSEIRALAAMMNFTSLCGNTADSLVARLSGASGTRADAKAAEELLIALLSVPIGGPSLALSALLRLARRAGLSRKPAAGVPVRR